MNRFLSRSEWPLIAAGVLAGLLTSALVLYFFFTGVGGGAPAADGVNDENNVSLSGERNGRAESGPRGVVGRQEMAVRQRLQRTDVPLRPLTGTLAVSVANVVWNERSGVRFAQLEAGSARLAAAGLGRGDVVLEGVRLQRPIVNLRQDRAGNWNYETVLAELLDGDGGGNGNGESGGKRVLQLREMRVADARVNVQRPEDRFAFTAVQGELPVVSLSQPGIAEPYLRLRRVTAVYDNPADDMRLPLSATDGIVHFPRGRVRFELATATVDEARLADVRGVFDPEQPGYGVTASGRAVALRFEDIRRFAPERLPESGTASFRWAVRPVAPDATEVTLTELDAATGESRVRGDVAFRVRPGTFTLQDANLQLDPLQLALVEQFSGRDLPYGGALTGRVTGSGGDIRFDLVGQLTTPELRQPFRTTLEGTVRLDPGGVTIREVTVGLDRVPVVALRAVAPGLPFSGLISGRVLLRGSPDRTPLTVDVRLEHGTGVITVAGEVDLTGSVPRYDVTGTLVNLNLDALVEPEVPPVFLTASFALNGAGTDPSTLSARLELAGRFSGWQTTARDTVDLATTIRNGTALVDRLNLRLATASVAANGEWRFTDPVSGAVSYRLAVADLRPFGPYLPAVGDSVASGSLEATGNLAGSLDRMRLAGEATGSSLRVGGWAAAGLATSYDVTLGAAVPNALVELDARGVETPTAGAFTAGRLSLRLLPPELNIQLTAERVNGGHVELAATGQIPLTGERVAVINRARVDMTQGGQWLLVQPAAIRWGGADGLTVQNLAVANAATQGLVRVNGRLLPLDRTDAQVHFAAFPIGDLLHLAGQPRRIEGELFADGTVRGGAAPVIDLTFRVEGGSLEQVPMQRMDGRLAYRDRVTEVQARVAMDTAGYMELDARLPSQLRIGDNTGFELIDDGALQGTLTASRFTLAPFRGMALQVRELTGYIDGQARLAGTVDQPRLDGTLALVDGHVMVPALNQRFSEITGRVGFAESRIVIEEIRARSDGWAVARGAIVLERLTRPVLDVDVELNGFRPMGVPDQRDAAVSGSIALDGPFDALTLTGGITVGDGYVVLPQVGGGLDRDLIDITRPAPVMGQRIETAGGEAWMRNLRITDLRVEVEDDTWFMAEEARVQLGGTLTVNKVGDATPIVGTLEGNRGEYTLVAGPIVRRFNVIAAQVRFLGGPQPNPAIDFTARRVIIDATGREVNVDVRISGTLDRYSVSLASGELSAMAESELLSFMLFGQPSFALGGNVLPGDDLLQQTFLGGFAELAALELERSVSGLGLDIFQIRWGAGPFAGVGAPTVIMGRQLRDDVFLTLETGLNALFGGDATLNTWAARLDWTFDRRSRARLALEPINRGRVVRSAGVLLPGATPQGPRRQLLLEVRRRWEW